MMLLVHVVSSSLALASGLLLLVIDKRWRFHGRLGGLYHWTMLVAVVSALAVSAARGRAVVFTYLAPPSYAGALLGYLSGRLRWRGWLVWHIAGQSASYIALVTGLGFQTIPGLLPPAFVAAHRSLVVWALLLLPTLVAQPLIARTQARWSRKAAPRLQAAA